MSEDETFEKQADIQSQDEGSNQPAEREDFAAMLARAAHIMMLTTPEGRVDFANHHFLRGFDLSAVGEEALWVLQQITHPEDYPAFEKAWRRAFDEGRNFDSQLRLRRVEDGQYHTHIVWIAPLLKEDRQISSWLIEIIRIEEQGQAILRNYSAQDFRELADNLPAIVWMSMANGRPLYFNQSFFLYTGRDPSRSAVAQWPAVIHPGDYEECVRRSHHCLRTGQPYEIFYRLRRHDGMYRWHIGRALPLRDSVTGEVRRWVGTCTDIEEQKRAMEAQELIAQVTRLLSSTLELDAGLGRVAQVLAEALSGCCSVHWVEGSNLELRAVASVDPHRSRAVSELDQRHPFQLTQEPAAGPIRAVLERQPVLYSRVGDEQLQLLARDPEHLRALRKLRVHTLLSVPLLSNNRVFGAITIFSSEAERVFGQAELTLLSEISRGISIWIENTQLFSEAQRANRIKDEFFAILSHELRTPLNAILGWAQLCRVTDPQSEDFRQGLETIERNARLQAAMINDLLDVSRILSGKLSVDLQRVSINHVLKDALEVCRAQIDSKHLKVHLDLQEPSLEVWGDGNRLQQVVWNLVTNAVKFTPEFGHITLRCRRQGNRAEIRVEDTGEGIEPRFLPYIFERFRQADSSTTRRHGGLGLGLAIVRSLVELHHGDIRVESEGLGRGTRFIARIPLFTEKAHFESSLRPLPEDNSANSSAAQWLIPADALTGRRILVVDDNWESRQVVFHMLKACGAQVSTAASAKEALQNLQEAAQKAPDRQIPYDLLISDIGMPDQDGYSFIREFRAWEQSQGLDPTPAIALTAYVRDPETQQALEAGFNLHISKPVNGQELIEKASALGVKVHHVTPEISAPSTQA